MSVTAAELCLCYICCGIKDSLLSRWAVPIPPRMTDNRISEINVVSDEGGSTGIDGGGAAESGDGHASLSPLRDRLSSSGLHSTGQADCVVALSQLGINTNLQHFLKGSDSAMGSSSLYSDIIDDVRDMRTSSTSSSSASIEYDSYFGLSKISSCYRKHTQSSASQSSPLFKISFTG